MGIASLILGIISIITAFTIILAPLGVFIALIGLILGIIDIIKKDKASEKKGISIAGTVICAVLFVILTLETIVMLWGGLLSFTGNIANDILNPYGNSNYGNNNSNTSKEDNNQNILQNSNVDNTKNEVLGTYTREIFSGNSFNYKTLYDNAIFKFNKDSTFECIYEGGATYKGTYEVYNGVNITAKASEIAEDTSIKHAENLAEDIREVSEEMMSSNVSSLLNTYLLYLKVTQVVENNISTNREVLQPFVIKYNPDTKTGDAVNIYGQTSGTFTLK